VVAPITAAGAAAIPVLVGVATGEGLTPLAIGGIALALVAIVLVSLGGDGPDDPLTVPDGWVEQYAPDDGPDTPEVGGLPSPTAATLIAAGPRPAPSAVVAEPERPTTPAALVAVLDQAAARELSTSMALRSVLSVMVMLLVALVITAGGIAAVPVSDLVAERPLSAGGTAMLAFSFATIVAALIGLRLARPLFAMVAPVVPASPAAPVPTRPSLWRRVVMQPGLPEALLSGAGFGTFYVFVGRTAESAGHWPMVTARSVSVVMFAIGALATRTPLLPAVGTRAAVVVAGIFDAAAAVLFVLATRAGLLSVGAVLASLYPAVTVLLARGITKERIAPRQCGGLALALGAVALLAL
jgi:hypothetical protein